MAVTKQQLATENATLRSRVSELEGLLQQAREQQETKQQTPREQTPREQTLREYAAARWALMQQARELAMRTGRTVKV